MYNYFLYLKKRIRNSQLILCHLSILQDNFLEPLGHRTAQLLIVVEGHVGDPHELDCLDQLGEGGDVAIVLQLSLHMTSTILDKIEVCGIAWPIQNAKLLLELLQVVHRLLALVARSIMQEVLALVESHERDQVIIQDFFVALLVHCTVLGEEVQTSLPLLATEASPHHNA